MKYRTQPGKPTIKLTQLKQGTQTRKAKKINTELVAMLCLTTVDDMM
jgi:hypothetical protein